MLFNVNKYNLDICINELEELHQKGKLPVNSSVSKIFKEIEQSIGENTHISFVEHQILWAYVKKQRGYKYEN